MDSYAVAGGRRTYRVFRKPVVARDYYAGDKTATGRKTVYKQTAEK